MASSELKLALCFWKTSLDVAEPVVDQPQTVAPQRGHHPAAAVMAANDDVPDLEHVHGELHDAEAVQVGMHHKIGHVAVYEEFAWRKIDDLVGRHAAVGAADPKKIRPLLPGKLAEEMGIPLDDLLGPGAVILKKTWQRSHETG